MSTQMSTNWIVETIEQLERAVGVFPRVEKFTASNGETYNVLRISIFSSSASTINLDALRKNMPRSTFLYYGNVVYPDDTASDLLSSNREVRFDLTAFNCEDASIILEFEGTEAGSRGWDGKRLAAEVGELESKYQLSFGINHADKLSFVAEVEFIPQPKDEAPSFENPHVYDPSTASANSKSLLPPESLGEESTNNSDHSRYAFNKDSHEHEGCDDEKCSVELTADDEAASEVAAEKLLAFCPDLFSGKGIGYSIKSLAAVLRSRPTEFTFVWPDHSPSSRTSEIESSSDFPDDLIFRTIEPTNN